MKIWSRGEFEMGIFGSSGVLINALVIISGVGKYLFVVMVFSDGNVMVMVDFKLLVRWDWIFYWEEFMWISFGILLVESRYKEWLFLFLIYITK